MPEDKKRPPDRKRVVSVGHSQVDMSQIVRDIRGIEDMLAEVMEKDWSENRWAQFDMRLTPFADAADIAEWDTALLYRHPALYTHPQGTCTDCPLGPCGLEKGKGRCGLDLEAFQAKLSLGVACRGCHSQMVASRELLNYALKVFGRGAPVHGGGPLLYMGDFAPSLGILTGIYAQKLEDLDRALSYAEGQLQKLGAASIAGTGTAQDFEGMTLHAGSLLFLAMELSELVKVSCFGFTSAAGQRMEDLIDYPPVTAWGGLGSVEAGKPVMAFTGDDFLPAYVAVKELQQKGLTERVEVCGVGAAGHDILRFYDRCRLLGPMPMATKLVRSGIADVVVVSSACLSLDIPSHAAKVGTKVILTTPLGSSGLRDRTDDPVADIVRDLVAGEGGVVVRDAEKAGLVALEVCQKVRRPPARVPSDAQVKQEAARCREDCDQCFTACPNSLLINQAVKKAVKEGVAPLTAVEGGCYFCGKCDEVCPEHIPLRDLILAAQASGTEKDKYPMRPGRGPIPDCEQRALTFALIYGNCPGLVMVQGCGDARIREDIGWIAHEMAARNCIVMTAGCGAGEIARYYDADQGKFAYQKFGAEYQSRMLINCGSCTAHVQLMDLSFRAARLAAGISHYANYAETGDYNYQRIKQVLIMWGVLSERQYAMAAGYARNGLPVIVGPATAFQWKRYLLGNKHDRSRWWLWDGIDGRKREIEPAPKHLIIPVETKEEAVAMAAIMVARATELRDMRQADIETYTDLYLRHFGELPDDWHRYIRTDAELPLREKARLLEELRDKHGWEIGRMRVSKPRHPDGRLMTVAEYVHNYSLEQGRYATCLHRLITRSGKQAAGEAKP